ncbi:phage regulatory CII family protein [Pseudodesulfovibrio tunisiensis]|uniref:phage regulatory CII family protein n=1 Tax=Pseudodesulfovibrio tunisiensis TaxID=463192 RepID=UPI001FB3C156|nr:phage regulatory CII family protein [Pseudodesulfovibrio tunisiensis]
MFEKNLTKKMQDVVLEGRIPAKEICSRIKKPYSTLLRELNPFDTHAKLGAETMFDIVKVTHNVSVLEFMARELGYTLTPLEAMERRPRPAKVAAKRIRRQAATV